MKKALSIALAAAMLTTTTCLMTPSIFAATEKREVVTPYVTFAEDAETLKDYGFTDKTDAKPTKKIVSLTGPASGKAVELSLGNLWNTGWDEQFILDGIEEDAAIAHISADQEYLEFYVKNPNSFNISLNHPYLMVIDSADNATGIELRWRQDAKMLYKAKGAAEYTEVLDANAAGSIGQGGRYNAENPDKVYKWNYLGDTTSTPEIMIPKNFEGTIRLPLSADSFNSIKGTGAEVKDNTIKPSDNRIFKFRIQAGSQDVSGAPENTAPGNIYVSDFNLVKTVEVEVSDPDDGSSGSSSEDSSTDSSTDSSSSGTSSQEPVDPDKDKVKVSVITDFEGAADENGLSFGAGEAAMKAAIVSGKGYKGSKALEVNNTSFQALWREVLFFNGFDKASDLSGADYLQFWVKNESEADAPLDMVRFYISKADGTVVIADLKNGASVLTAKKGASKWSTLKASLPESNGRGKLVIPQGFEGFVRIPLKAENFLVQDTSGQLISNGTFSFATDKVMRFSVYATNPFGAIYFDDVAAVGVNANKAGLEYVTEENYFKGYLNASTNGDNADTGVEMLYIVPVLLIVSFGALMLVRRKKEDVE